jgi:uncharacterized membrane protein (DUF106 family)
VTDEQKLQKVREMAYAVQPGQREVAKKADAIVESIVDKNVRMQAAGYLEMIANVLSIPVRGK